MHGNRRYVKLTLIGLLGLLSLAAAAGARAEVVTTRADRGVLAVTRDALPFVAYADGRELQLASRARGGGWRAVRLGRLPGSNVTLAGIRVSDRPHRYVALLAQDTAGRWLTLARGSRLVPIARPGPGSLLGSAGLTLDAQGRPAVAYAVRRPSGQTFLRLVTFDRRWRRHVQGITQGGFPTSSSLPGAAPVLVRGRLHVVETYSFGAIDWGRNAEGKWEGQFLFSSRLGSPVGPVGAVFAGSTLFSAWTQIYPEVGPEESSVLVNASAATQETGVLTHGSFVTVVAAAGAPEVGAVDWLTLPGGWREYAALVMQGPGSAAWQLDGRLEGYGVAVGDVRQVLLSRDRGLEWFQVPPPAAYGIELWLAVDPVGKVTGTVVGQTDGGSVAIYRERANAPRELVATAPVAADSSFAVDVPPPTSDTAYRGVYEDPRTGLPFAFLPGVPVGVTG